MKKYLPVLIFSLSFLFTAAQESDLSKRFYDQATGNLLYTYQAVDVQGSQFLFDKWTRGKLTLDNGQYVDNVMLKYDIYNNRVVANKGDTAFELSPIVREVRFYTSADTALSLVLKKGYSFSDRMKKDIYVQVFAEGKIGFFKYLKKNLDEYQEYGNATKLKRFNDVSQYYVSVNGQYRMTSLSKKNLQELTTDKWKQVSDFLAENNLNGKDEKSWQMAIRYYNTL